MTSRDDRAHTADDTQAPPLGAVVVLGMARSGTSAITRLLALMGVDLGPQEALLAPIEGENAKGFFEHKGLMRINKELLERAGGSWDDPPSLREGWERDAGLDDLRERARELIATDFAGARLWGFKDPRTSLTLPFWDGLLAGARYVICHRRPLDSARSLQRRNGIRLDTGVELWTRYTACALAHTAGRERILVGYERLFGERDALVGELARFLGVSVAERDAELRMAAGEWVDAGLRHHAASLREQVEHPAVEAEAQALYALLALEGAERARGAEATALGDALDGMAVTLLRRVSARTALAPAGTTARRAPTAGVLFGKARSAGGTPEDPAAASGLRTSVVVVLADDPWGAMACLESVCELRPAPHEIVLVDNASLGLRATLDTIGAGARVVRLQERVGALRALWEGVRETSGELVVCLPAPALLTANALAVLWGTLGEGATPEADRFALAGGAGIDTGGRALAGGAAGETAAPALAAVLSDPAVHDAHQTAARAIGLRRRALDALAALAQAGVREGCEIAALCCELARRGGGVAYTDAHAAAPPTALCRRGPGAESIEVSVAIPTLDATSAQTRACVRAVQATLRVAHEIVLVDNGAPPQGFTAPVNAALRAARGRHLVVMNDDVRVLDGWWEPLADALDGGEQVVFPLTIEGRMRWDFAAWCFALRREAFERLAAAPGELLDPAMVVWCQDLDLRERLRVLSAPPRCVPESRIRHAGSRTVRVGAEHAALRSWVNAQAARDTEIFRARHPYDAGARAGDAKAGPGERDTLPPGPPALTAEHAESTLVREPVRLSADGPRWHTHELDWPAGVGHFFLAGRIDVHAPDAVADILVRAIFADGERELFWIDLVPGTAVGGRAEFLIPRERARAIRAAGDAGPPAWSEVRTVRLCARARLHGALGREPGAAGAASATITELRLLAQPAEVAAR